MGGTPRRLAVGTTCDTRDEPDVIGGDERLYLLYDRDQDQNMDEPPHVRVVMVGPVTSDLRALEAEFAATVGLAYLHVVNANWFAGWLVEHKAFRLVGAARWRRWSMW